MCYNENMNMKKYLVKCLKCKGSNVASITEVRPNDFYLDLNEDHKRHPDNIHIISGRYLADMQFGWECICGNDSRLAREEFSNVEKLMVNGGKQAIQKITNSLKIEDKKKFLIVEV